MIDIEQSKAAATAGDAEAQYTLGVLYASGQTVPQDYSEALKWFTQAAQQGHPAALYNLGIQFAKGQGVPRDYKKAVEYLYEADKHGNPEAGSALAWLFAFVETTEEETFQWYLILANKGDVSAQNKVGLWYVSGRGTPQNDEKAIYWFRKAAAAGCQDAQENLRLMGIKQK